MIKRVLVPTDGSPSADIGVRYAIDLAKQHAASLLGLHVIDIRLIEGPFVRDIYTSLGASSFATYQEDVAHILEERATEVMAQFEAACGDAGVSFEAVRETGAVARTIIDKSSLVDLVIIGRQGEHSAFLGGLLGSTTEAVVRRAKSPVLVTDRDYCRIRRYVAGYDGSEHSRRALQFAAAISEQWDLPFDVLAVGDGAARWLEEARGYLAAHGLDVEYSARDGDPADALIDYAREREADAIVMGAYGHSKVRAWVVGSTTAHTLNHAPCPVLLAR